MKDILSMLQSRIDKRARLIPELFRNRFESGTHKYWWECAIEDQKFEKQVTAEIVSLRRKVSRNCEED